MHSTLFGLGIYLAVAGYVNSQNPAGNTPPVIEPCPTQVREFPAGNQVFLIYNNAVCSDAEDGTRIVSCDPASGTLLPSFSGRIECTCSDTASAMVARNCTAADANTPPQFAVGCPARVTESAPTDAASTIVAYNSPICVDLEDGVIEAECSRPSLSTFNLGTTDVICTCADQGNMAVSCSFQVEVNEGSAYLVNCPETMVVNAPPGTPSAVVTYPTDICTDAQGVPIVVICSTVSGSTFPVGETPVTCTCMDAGVLTATCTIRVQVNAVNSPPQLAPCPSSALILRDTPNEVLVVYEAPVCTDVEDGTAITTCDPPPGSRLASFNGVTNCRCTDAAGALAQTTCILNSAPTQPQCPGAITETIIFGNVDTAVNFQLPTCADFEQTVITSVCDRTPGSRFPIGSTLVMCECTDAGNLMASCVFNVIVQGPPNTAPTVVNCPDSVTMTAAAGSTFAEVVYTEPSCSDTEDRFINVACTPGSRSTLPGGVTNANCLCTDTGGLVGSCTFPITVQINTPPSMPQCPQDITVVGELGASSASATFTPPSCSDVEDGPLAVTCNQPAVGTLPVGVTTVTCTCRDSGGSESSCAFSITIQARVAPILTCPSEVRTVVLQNNGVDVRYNPLFCAEPSAPQQGTTISCTPAEGFFGIGDQQVSCTCIDEQGDTDTCSFMVSVIDVTPPVVSNCPNNLPPFRIDFGDPGVFVQWAVPTATDNDGREVNVVASQDPFFATQAGTATVTYTFTDSSQNRADCIFAYTVIAIGDTEAPVITCPESVTIPSLPDQNGNVLTYSPPMCSDNSGDPTITCNPPSGTFSPIGAAQAITCTCADAVQLANTCVFQYTIIDTTPPTVTCPQSNLVFDIPFGASGVTVTWSLPTAADNEGVPPQLTSTEAPNTIVEMAGTRVVTYTATDTSGNQASCNFVYTVIARGDTDPPEITCPETVTTVASPQPVDNPTMAGANVFFEVPQCVDNSKASTVTCLPGANSFFGITETPIACSCVDPAGLSDTCTFNVVVTDATPPDISGCPGNIVETVAITQIGAIVPYATPRAQDNSGIATLISVPQPPGFFTLGSTSVEYVYRDPTGNEATCAFSIAVTAVDNEPPVIVLCPQDQTVTVLRGEIGGIVNFPNPLATDNSGFVYVSNDPQYQSGFYFPLGTTTVTYVFSDAVPLTTTCQFVVTVNRASPCDDGPCLNGGACVAKRLTQFSCVCPNCFLGERCEVAQSPCATNNQCLNGGECMVFPGSCTQTFCVCPSCFAGANCQIIANPCDNNECTNGGICVPDPVRCDTYSCLCTGCWFGELCEQEFDPCARAPCANNGVCSNLAESCTSFSCECTGCFTGFTCDTLIPDPCAVSPCLNGGVCQRTQGTCYGYTCQCLADFSGILCENNVARLRNPCNNFPCENSGQCVSLSRTDYKCICRAEYSGIRCAELTSANEVSSSDSCRFNPCSNGASCFNSYSSPSGEDQFISQYTCICASGFAGQNCNIPLANLPQFDVCSTSGLMCLNGGTCRNSFCSFSSDLTTFCECPVGFYGEICQIIDSNRCSSLPCRNGGQCTPFSRYFLCQCPAGFSGPTCELADADTIPPAIRNCPVEGVSLTANVGDDFAFVTWPDLIVTDNSGHCHLASGNGAPGNYPVGSRNVELVYEDASGNAATCAFVITVSAAPNDPCVPSPCQNSGVCLVSGFSFSCQCVGGFTGPTCTEAPPSPCAMNPCLNDGVCIPSGDTFSCQCVNQFIGQFCQQAAPGDPCAMSPCFNGGMCVPDGTTTFTCQCVGPFVGQFCQQPAPVNPCTPNPCLNSAVCVPMDTTFACQCVGQFTGDLCELPAGGNAPPVLACPAEPVGPNFALPTCTDAEDGMLTPQCFPPPGSAFAAGSTPGVCLCTDSAGQSTTCQFNVQTTLMSQCAPNPCSNGAVCDPMDSTFMCQCVGPFTGELCEQPVDPCAPNPCSNNAVCVPMGTIFMCQCVGQFTGELCETPAAVVTAPVIVCPAGSVTSPFVAPTCTDAEDGVITPQCFPPIATTNFATGSNFLVCLCTDRAGETSNCQFTVNGIAREDGRCGAMFPAPNGEPAQCDPNGELPCCSNEAWCGITPEHCTCEGCVDFRVMVANPPTISACPLTSEHRLTIPAGEMSALVSYALPVCNQGSPGEFSAVCAPPRDSQFPLGLTPVTCTCTDIAGLQNQCGFSVEVIESAPPEEFAQCPGLVEINSNAPGEHFVRYQNVICPAGQTGSCVPGNEETLAGDAPEFVDVCCSCSAVGAVVSQCCFPRLYDPAVHNIFVVNSVGFSGPYPGNTVQNVVVSSGTNIQAQLLYFTVVGGDVLRVGTGRVIGRNTERTFQDRTFASIPDTERVFMVNGTTLWISFESRAETVPDANGYVILIGEDMP